MNAVALLEPSATLDALNLLISFSMRDDREIRPRITAAKSALWLMMYESGSLVNPNNRTALNQRQPNPAFKRTDTGGAHLRVIFVLRAPVPAA